MKFSLKIISFFLLCYAITACDQAPIYDDTPAISFVGFGTDTVQQFSGVTTLIIGFEDGDGDLGGDEDPSMIIVDNRQGDTSFYNIPDIPQQGAASGIAGEIEVDLAGICCVLQGFPIACVDIPDTYDTVTYTVQIKDNANRWSNAIQTDPLAIKCYQ